MKGILKKVLPLRLIAFLIIIKDIISNKVGASESAYNKIYLWFFVFSNNITHYNNVHKEVLKKSSNINIKKYSNELQHSPMLKLSKYLNEIENKNDYHFIDIGHGLGILLYFIKKKHDFKSFNGIEINKDFYDKSIANIKNLKLKKNEINLKNISADKYILDNKKYFIYFYNLFKNQILYKFLKIILKLLKNITL